MASCLSILHMMVVDKSCPALYVHIVHVSVSNMTVAIVRGTIHCMPCLVRPFLCTDKLSCGTYPVLF